MVSKVQENRTPASGTFLNVPKAKAVLHARTRKPMKINMFTKLNVTPYVKSGKNLRRMHLSILQNQQIDNASNCPMHYQK